MAQQPQLFRVKATKMFKASIGGAQPQMINPGDVVEVDRWMAGMLIQSEKAEVTKENLAINPNYQAPVRPAAADTFSLLARAVENLTKIVQEFGSARQKSH